MSSLRPLTFFNVRATRTIKHILLRRLMLRPAINILRRTHLVVFVSSSPPFHSLRCLVFGMPLQSLRPSPLFSASRLISAIPPRLPPRFLSVTAFYSHAIVNKRLYSFAYLPRLRPLSGGRCLHTSTYRFVTVAYMSTLRCVIYSPRSSDSACPRMY
jgi:hypothetical protein